MFVSCDTFRTDILANTCQNAANIVIVTDNNLFALYKHRLEYYFLKYSLHVNFIALPAGEHSKSRACKLAIEQKLFQLGCARDTMLIAFGGGVISDLTGFVAATYLRGIPVVYVPTSLMAMVDAAIGGKTGINTEFGKNTLGTFTQPSAVLTDVSLLDTLPDPEYYSAISEIIKHALIKDENYFNYIDNSLSDFFARDPACLKMLVATSQNIKLQVVRSDMMDLAEREILNFGHTIAHALESATQYKISHGVAVLYGLAVELIISNRSGLLADKSLQKILSVINRVNLFCHTQLDLSIEMIIQALVFDKKRRDGLIRFVLLSEIGQAYQTQGAYSHVVSAEVVRSAMEFAFSNLKL